MIWNRDLKDPRWMYLKAILFGLIVLFAGGLLILLNPTWMTTALVIILIWASARLYYFFFYVIEKYIDPGHRFAGVLPALQHLSKRKRERSEEDDPNSGGSA